MIQIVKASAGSGKTFNLAREYIRLLLQSRDPQAYRHILAVTFTNKATDEMKRCILRELFILATEPEHSGYYADFVPALFLDAEALRQRADSQLCSILHDYSAFAISTIDRFFQQALRAFSREIGQFASYQVDLDKEGLVEESVDRILDTLTEADKNLLEWLTDSVRTGLEKGDRFNLEPHLRAIAMSLRSEDHDAAVERYGIDEKAAFSKENLKAVQRGCNAVAGDFTEKVEAAARAVLAVLEEHGIRPEDSNRGFLIGLYKYLDLDRRDTVKPPTASFLAKAGDSRQWFAKGKDPMRLELEGSLEEPLGAFCALFGRPYQEYRTARIIRDQVYGLGIAGELRQAFADIQREKNVISIDDSNTLLRQIIDGSDAPFVYEKLGVRYEDFLLDEFQDTSIIQWENFRPLLHNSVAGGFDNLIVGDVKQSIYRWRGSDWNLLDSQLTREFRLGEEQVRVLKGNYRTLREIVQFNNGFFAYAAGELDGLLGEDPAAPGSISTLYRDVAQEVCVRDAAPGSVDVSFCEDTEAEMDEVLATIATVLEAGGYYGDIAILVRGNAEGAVLAARLVAEGIPVVSDDSLFVKSSVTVRRLVSQMALVDAPDPEGRPTAGRFLARSMDVRIPDNYHSLVDLAESLLRDLRKADPAAFEAEIPYIQSFMDYLQDWAGLNGNHLPAFLRDWESASPKIASPQLGSSVRVMTVHKSKGLEFPYVIFPFAEKVTLYKNSSYWCRPAVEGTALERFADGVYHVSLGTGSEDTLFAEDYRRERKLQFIDNINVFYVALTRAQYGLKVIAVRPPEKLDGWKNLSQVLYGYVGGLTFHAGELYPFATMERRGGEAAILQADYPSFALNQDGPGVDADGFPLPANERGRLKFSGEAVDYFGPDGTVGPHASSRRRGLVLHKILSGVVVPGDLPRSVERVIRTGELEASDRVETIAFLQDKIAAVSAHGWFPDEGACVRNETAILGPDGRESRPDRVVLHADGSVDIIDYKSGHPEERYLFLMRRYKRLWTALGHAPVRAWLWYLREDAPDDIVEVQ